MLGRRACHHEEVQCTIPSALVTSARIFRSAREIKYNQIYSCSRSLALISTQCYRSNDHNHELFQKALPGMSSCILSGKLNIAMIEMRSMTTSDKIVIMSTWSKSARFPLHSRRCEFRGFSDRQHMLIVLAALSQKSKTRAHETLLSRCYSSGPLY